MSESLKGKVDIIAVAAGGFSKATAELFAKKDLCNLVMIGSNEEGIEEYP